LYSLISIAAAVATVGILLWIKEVVTHKPDPLGSFIFFCIVTLYLGVPGWFLAMPFVLCVKNVRGWRLWMLLLVGCSVGPLVIVGVAIWTFARSGTLAGFAPEANGLFLMAMGVSTVATVVYLLLLRRDQLRIQ
jgi:hypothetical protein